MKLTVSSPSGAIELSALTGRRMDRLTALAVVIVNAMPDSEATPKRGFGFTAGKHIETEIAEEPCPDVVAIRRQRGRRP